MTNKKNAKDDGPERGEERRPSRSISSERAAAILGLLVQVVTLIGQISDLFR